MNTLFAVASMPCLQQRSCPVCSQKVRLCYLSLGDLRALKFCLNLSFFICKTLTRNIPTTLSGWLGKQTSQER